ncbi:sodium-independent sulfate anion transporter-like isoform X1 [Ctenocephalides felis]|uniref:sodium-independent sulfate anion transporter-like isoform X1 n=1 Tax=Ctenocephalides felis TaxID=7515 RepID=UPI000E6E243A|nr:sodium-independent sulfate anion transporter-like isoform X1 [Ctenocephalides felis]XP_026468299.1 sodium-independent sulfate anion transporter-like isoform X1 [Ctenocephalides felis]
MKRNSFELTNNGNGQKQGNGTGEQVHRPTFRSHAKDCASACCTRKTLERHLPIVNWLPKYTWEKLGRDAIAGLTVGLTAIPQGIAYAVVAGLEPQYGLYAGFMGCFVYIFLGGCKDVTIGPTAIMALMVQRYVQDLGPDFAILSTFLGGLVILALGLLHLGFLVEFISMPVTAGFTSAAAITIASSQFKSLLGLPGSGNSFVEAVGNVIKNISHTQLWDALLGFSTIIILLLLRKLKDVKGRWSKVARGFSLGRNAIAVIGGTLLAYLFSINDMTPFKLTGKVGEGLPPFRPPPLSTVVNNQTIGFMEMVQHLGGSVAALPLVSILESIAIAKAFSKGRAVDATQEMLALGTCNVLGSFFLSMPTTGSFTRTAVNNASGVETTFGGAFTGALILIALSVLTSTFYYIPKATLAAVILCAMFFMLEIDHVKLIWRTRKIDILPFIVTWLVCLFFGLEYGMLAGVSFNLLFILYSTARPNIDVKFAQVDGHEILIVTPDQSLVFSASDYVRSYVLERCGTDNKLIVVINGENVNSIDTTVARSFKVLCDDMKVREQNIFFWNWNKSSSNVLRRLDPKTDNLFRQSETIAGVLQKSDDITHVITAENNHIA